MLGEDLDIGLYAEDAYAAYITQVATTLEITPDFRNARGATVDVVFSGPFMGEASFQETATALLSKDGSTPRASLVDGNGDDNDVPVWERLAQMPQTSADKTVVLHAWIEKLNGARKMQLTETVHLLRKTAESPNASTNAEDSSERTNDQEVAAASHRRVLGNLDFLLHLSTRNLLLGESNNNASQDTLSMEKYGAPFGVSGAAASMSDAARAASAVRDALEQRDDVAVARNAVDTVVKFARLAEEHAGEVATVYVDAMHGEEYLQFGS